MAPRDPKAWAAVVEFPCSPCSQALVCLGVTALLRTGSLGGRQEHTTRPQTQEAAKEKAAAWLSMGWLSLSTGTAEGNSRTGVGMGEEEDGSSSCPGVWGQESGGCDNCQGLNRN